MAKWKTPIELPADPSVPLGATTKQYVDSGLATKANEANAALTGVPTAPTAAAATNTTQIATTAHVKAAIDYKFQGPVTLSGDLLPDVDNVRSLGSPTAMWKDVYIGPGSLYLNGQKILEDTESGTIVMRADPGQNISIQTYTTGDVELAPQGTGLIQLKGNVMFDGASLVRSSDGLSILFDDSIEFTPGSGIVGGLNIDGSAAWHGGNFNPALKLDVGATAASAIKLSIARPIALTGPVTAAGVEFDGSGSVTLITNIADAALSIAKTSGLQTALDARLSKSGGTITGPLIVSGATTTIQFQSGAALDMNNHHIANVNSLTFSDPGEGEGLSWAGGSGWEVYESPDTLLNGAGNLQIVLAGVRHTSFNIDGSVDVLTGPLRVGGNTVLHTGTFNPTSKLDVGATAVAATKLATARLINGVAFDGTTDITIAAGGAATMAANTIAGNNTGVSGPALDLTATQVKTMLALQNVDNTNDISKPVSTAQQNALNLKANLTGATFGGVVGFTTDGDASQYLFDVVTSSATAPRLRLGTVSTPGQYFEIGAFDGKNNFDSKGRNLRLFSNASSLEMDGTTGMWTCTGQFNVNNVGGLRSYGLDGNPNAGVLYLGTNSYISKHPAAFYFSNSDLGVTATLNSGGTIWTSTNLNPATKVNIAGDTMTGALNYANGAVMLQTPAGGTLTTGPGGASLRLLAGGTGAAAAVFVNFAGTEVVTVTELGLSVAGTASFGGNVTSNLNVVKDNPWMTLDSASTGGDGVEQGAGISIGESGYKGAAAVHLTYTGDGRGHLGMGLVDPVTGIPANEVMTMFYTSNVGDFKAVPTINGAALNYTHLTGTVPDAALSGSGLYNVGRIRANATGDVTLAGDTHALQAGPTTAANIAIDGNEIQARNNGVASQLNLQVDGGTTTFGGDLTGAFISAVASNNTIVKRHASGYIFANYFNTTADVTAVAPTHVMVETGGDSYIRKQTVAVLAGHLRATSTWDGDQSTDYQMSKYLRWKNYGNGHVIIDASQGTAPNGAAINNADSAAAWSPTYPTLMGWNGSQTYGVRVDMARWAEGAADATTLAGKSATSAGTANTAVLRNTAGDIITDRLFRTGYGDAATISGAIAYRVNNTTDNYIRFCSSPSAVVSWLGLAAGDNVAFTRVSVGYDSGIANSIGCSGWFRASGQTGLFCASYGGGIYMTDATYVRTYGSKQMAAADFVISSDVRLKTAIRPLKFKGRLRPVNFSWRKDGAADFGFIAQEVELLYPEAVGEIEGDVTKGEPALIRQLSYQKLTAVLSHQINSVEDDLAASKKRLEQENAAMRAQLAEVQRKLEEHLMFEQYLSQ